jgi:hypothetical protein
MTDFRLDMAQNPVRVGDFVAFVTGGGRRKACLSFGRVVRLTGKGVAVKEVFFAAEGYRVYLEDYSGWRELDTAQWVVERGTQVVSKNEKFLYISQHSLPKEAFELLDSLVIS